LQLRALYGVLMPSGFRARAHSVAAIASAILVHGLFAILFLNAQSRLPPLILPSIPVTLLFEPVEPAALTPDIAPEPIIESVPETPADAPAVPPAGSVTPERVFLPPAETPVSARYTSESVTAETNRNEDTYILSPATQSVLRGLQCPGDPDAFARTGICPQGAGRHSQMVASGERASDFYTIDVAAIRAMFGQAPHALAGQSTLSDGTQRRSLSNADSMRETLPSSSPDPAFGD
jgi:hypothetical protein